MRSLWTGAGQNIARGIKKGEKETLVRLTLMPEKTRNEIITESHVKHLKDNMW